MLSDNRAVSMIIILFCLMISTAIGGTPQNSAIYGLNIKHKDIKDITLLDQGSVLLYWTAPGDDGDVGRASGYDLRYTREASGPIDTEAKWWQATQVGGVPVPSQSGQEDSMVIANLSPGAGYYFCIKAYDDANNYSGLSNSPLVYASGDTGSGDFIPGDVNDDNMLNGNDVIFIVNYFKGANNIPDPFLRADANGSCMVNGMDVVYLVNYFRGGDLPFRGNCR